MYFQNGKSMLGLFGQFCYCEIMFITSEVHVGWCIMVTGDIYLDSVLGHPPSSLPCIQSTISNTMPFICNIILCRTMWWNNGNSNCSQMGMCLHILYCLNELAATSQISCNIIIGLLNNILFANLWYKSCFDCSLSNVNSSYWLLYRLT